MRHFLGSTPAAALFPTLAAALFPVLAAALVLSGCGGGATRLEDVNTTTLTLPDGSKIVAETMIQELDTTRGMMFRDALAPRRGMIMIYPREEKHPAFTYQCRVPLDILWMDRDQRIVEIAADAPPCPSKSAKACPIYGGAQNSRYALELNGGGAKAYGLKVGDKLSF
jgi:uncharacterized membrane protein (UPF0127 family)